MRQNNCFLTAMLLSCLLFCTSSLMAQTPKATLHKDDATVKEILRVLEKETDYAFFWNTADFDSNRKTSVHAENMSVTDIIALILPQMECKVDKRKIILVKKVGGDSNGPADTSSSKSYAINGVIVDEDGQPLPGASAAVRVDGTVYGTVTDLDGVFALELPGAPAEDVVMECSFIGFITESFPIGDRTSFNVVLRSDKELLSESVVVGYGVQKKVNLTGSVAAVTNESLNRRPVMRASASLSGLAAGVTVTQTSGQPGSDGATIRVRGVGTLSDSNPLVLVDGGEGSLDGVNPNDIESISILKDAASSAIYGSRAANGVILVTTKSGSEGKLTASYNGYVGWQSPTALPEFTSNYDYMLAMNQARENVGQSPLYSEDYLKKYLRYKSVDPDHYPDWDYQALLTTGSGFTQNHHASVSGGTKKLQAFASFAYQSQEGYMAGYDTDRYSLKARINANVTDFLKLGLLIDGRRATTVTPTYGSSMLGAINRTPGLYPLILSDGRYGPGYNNNNYLALCREGGKATSTTDNIRATVSATLTPVEGLVIDFKWSPNLSNTYKKTTKKSVPVYNSPEQESPVAVLPEQSSLSQSESRYIKNTIQAIATYNRTFRKNHDFGVLVGYEQITHDAESHSLSRTGFVNDDYEVMDAGSIALMDNAGSASAWSLLSAFARVNYSYKSRYLFEANFRADGSSRFAKGNRFGYFPSFSAAWRISEEGFMKGLSWLNNLKIRASWGQLGNQEIGTYPSYVTINFNPAYIFGGVGVDGGLQTSFANSDISWETSVTTNVGLDFAFLRNRLYGSFDWYVKNTHDILLKLPIPEVTGMTAPYQNAGVVRNTGWDLEIGHKNTIGDFNYAVNFNLSDVRNEVIDLKGAGPIIDGYEIIDEGYPINSLYGYKTDGLFRTKEELLNHPDQSYFGDYGLGDIKYVNVSDSDGTTNTINASDRTVIGNQIPRFTYGLNISAGWKGIDLTVFIQGIGKRDIILQGDAVWALHNAGKMQTWMMDNWTEDNIDASYPRLVATSEHNNFQMSDFWVYNASFLRLKTLQLGYTFPENWMKKINVSNLRVYVTGDNILTYSKLPKGWDPEMGSGEAKIYPLTKTWLFGVQLSF